jgi:hypothetical protein
MPAPNWEQYGHVLHRCRHVVHLTAGDWCMMGGVARN